MGQQKYPVQHRSEIDFETGGVNLRLETSAERSACLKRIASRRRGRILWKFKTEGIGDFLYALCRALQMAIDEGQRLPLHFNIKYFFKESGQRDTTLTERFTLEKAFTFNDLWTGKPSWHVFLRILKRRKSDDGIELAFPPRAVVFSEKGSLIKPQPV